ncbi:cystine/glutamate transporter-like isoform X2 [Ahaetulla prasina]|uniref:cystine/glutamate transporter-like isoform X2 n=1 Tax=Ahaetulla prasina TaxID=499056 RepID=UPI0026476B13|nr:cystine/glutamate transporter-like isoform X2 [Ahaetulla prasina]
MGPCRKRKAFTEEKDAVFLRRKITLTRAIALAVGSMVGSGIFISPKGVLQNSGNVGVSLLVWLACGILSLFGALSYADLGTCITKSGGHYIYLLETLGPLPAFLRLWAEFIMIRPANIAVVSLAFGRYLIEPFFASCHVPPLAVKLVTMAGITLAIVLNCWSVSWAAKVQTGLTVLKMVTVGLIIVPGILALGNGHHENFQDSFDTSSLTLEKLPLAFYSGMFAYGGWFYINFVTEEIVNPKKNIPRAVIVSLIVVTVCYVLTNVSYYAVLTPQEILSSDAVAVSFTDKVFKNISSAILILVALSCFGALNGGIFAASRMLFAAAREGQWPALFSMIHLERHTPVPALILMLPLVYLMVSIGDLYGLLNFYSFSRWFFIGLTTLGFMIHCFRHPTIPRPFKVPLFFPLVFTIACFFIVGTSLYSDPVNTSIGCALTLSGLPVYYLVVQKTRIPGCCTSKFNSMTVKLQILMKVTLQEVQMH